MNVFQEKHVTGWLPWNKKIYYTYWIHRNGVMEQLSIHSTSFVKSMEKS